MKPIALQHPAPLIWASFDPPTFSSRVAPLRKLRGGNLEPYSYPASAILGFGAAPNFPAEKGGGEGRWSEHEGKSDAKFGGQADRIGQRKTIPAQTRTP